MYYGLQTKDTRLLQEVQTDIKDNQIFIKVSHNYYSFKKCEELAILKNFTFNR